MRKSLKLTQAEFAKRLGLSQGFVCNVEKNRAKFTVEHIISIANTFKVDTQQLIQGEEFIVMEHPLGYRAPVHSKKEAIKRIVVLVEGMNDEKVFEVLKYVEDKDELLFYQLVGRSAGKQTDE